MEKKLIHIGTSGWMYKHWIDFFYPSSLSRKKWFDFFSKRIKTVEINNSFYRIPEEKIFIKWKNESPSNFIFSVKLFREITHENKLYNCSIILNEFLKRASLLEHKLGSILIQLPPFLMYDYNLLLSFLKLLPPDFKFTFEFRNHSWWNQKTYNLLKKYNSAFCMFHISNTITPRVVTADHVYVRLHGPSIHPYQGEYKNPVLKKWSKFICGWNKSGKEVFFYFNNDQNAYAVQDVLKLNKFISEAEKENPFAN